MAAFSFTAPRFTEEMNEAERNAMTEEEKEKIQAEMFGLACNDNPEENETPEMLQDALKELQTHLDTKIEYKPAYLEALDKCPRLVQTESAPIRFLRADSFDIQKAAERLVNYWETRKKLFGPDKCFLPIRLEGGAMQELDLEYLQQIPEMYWTLNEDDYGRCIFLTDKSRINPSKRYDRKAMLRFLWYTIHVALETEKYQRRGFVAVPLMRISQLGQLDRRLQVDAFKSLNTALPVRFNAVHICHPPAFFSVVWPVLSFVMGKDIRQRTFIRKGTDDHVLKELLECGIQPETLPRSMGGQWTLDIDRWMTERKELEAQRHNTDDDNNNNNNNNDNKQSNLQQMPHVRVIAGQLHDVQGPAMTYSPVNLWDVTIPASGSIVEIPYPAHHSCIIFCRLGSVTIMGDDNDDDNIQTQTQQLKPQDVAILELTKDTSSPSMLQLQAQEDNSSILIMGGEPIDEPIVQKGPFVMNTKEEIFQAYRDFRAGKFGQ